MTTHPERPILFSGQMVQAILAGRKTQTRRVMKPQPVGLELDPDYMVNGECPSRWFRFDPGTNARLEYARPAVRRKASKGQREKTKGWQRSRYGSDGPQWTESEVIGLCPYGLPGDRLWVRESFGAWFRGYSWRDTFCAQRTQDRCDQIFYRATHNYPDDDQKWIPSIHMPRWASRITLEVTAVRVQRVQEISEEDAKAEGAMYVDGGEIGHSGWRHDFKDVFATAKASFLWQVVNGRRGFGWEVNPWVWCISFRRIKDGQTENQS